MQRRIDNKVLLEKIVSPFDSISGSSSTDRTASNFTNATEKVHKIKRLINTGEYDADLAKYIPGMLNLLFQGIIENVIRKEQVAHISYKVMESVKQLLCKSKQYAYLFSNEKKKKASDKNSDISMELMPVKKFFVK